MWKLWMLRTRALHEARSVHPGVSVWWMKNSFTGTCMVECDVAARAPHWLRVTMCTLEQEPLPGN